MGLFDKKNNSKKTKNRKVKNKGGFSKSPVRNAKGHQSHDTVIKPFDEAEHSNNQTDLQTNISEVQKSSGKSKTRRRQAKPKKDKKQGNGLLTLLKNKKSAKNNKTLTDKQTVGYDVEENSSLIKAAGVDEPAFNSDGADSSVNGAGSDSSLDTSIALPARNVKNNNLLKILASILFLLLLLAIAALMFLNMPIKGGTIKAGSSSKVTSTTEQLATDEQDTQNSKPFAAEGLTEETTKLEDTSADSEISSVDSSNDQVVDSNPSREETELEQKQKSTELNNKEVVNTNESNEKVEETDNQSSHIAIVNGQADSTEGSSNGNKVGKVTYDDFINQAGTTLYREE